jgi:hypothetical protein
MARTSLKQKLPALSISRFDSPSHTLDILRSEIMANARIGQGKESCVAEGCGRGYLGRYS